MEQNEIDYTSYAENWIALSHMVKAIHNASLIEDWEEAYICSVKCKVLSEKLSDFFDGMIE
jgi:hypothetical protein